MNHVVKRVVAAEVASIHVSLQQNYARRCVTIPVAGSTWIIAVMSRGIEFVRPCPAAAQYQVTRVARARHLDPSSLRALIVAHTHLRQWGIFGEPRVNVLELNLALSKL